MHGATETEGRSAKSSAQSEPLRRRGSKRQPSALQCCCLQLALRPRPTLLARNCADGSTSFARARCAVPMATLSYCVRDGLRRAAEGTADGDLGYDSQPLCEMEQVLCSDSALTTDH